MNIQVKPGKIPSNYVCLYTYINIFMYIIYEVCPSPIQESRDATD